MFGRQQRLNKWSETRIVSKRIVAHWKYFSTMYRLRWYCYAILSGSRFSELRPIYHGCRALTFALARLSCCESNKGNFLTQYIEVNMNKIVIKILKGSVVTRSVFGELTIHVNLLIANFLWYIQGDPKIVSYRTLSVSSPNINQFSQIFSPIDSVEKLLLFACNHTYYVATLPCKT